MLWTCTKSLCDFRSVNLVKQKSYFTRAFKSWRTVVHHGLNINHKTQVTKAFVIERQNCWEVWWAFEKCWMGTGKPQILSQVLVLIMNKSWSTQTEMNTFVFCYPKKGNPCVIFVRNVSLRNLKSLFDWGHLFFMHVARGKFCKSRKFSFWSFPEVITIWRIQC